MSATLQGSRRYQPVAARRRFPDRTLHVVDIENLAGASIPSRGQVSDVQGRYVARLRFGAADQVVMAASHLGLLNVALGWPHARYRVRSGPDGADLELLDVLLHEDVAGRFTHVVIGSGDGVFGQAAQNLSARGVLVTVVSRRDSLSPWLARVAADVVYLDVPRVAAALASQSGHAVRGRVGDRLLRGHAPSALGHLRKGLLAERADRGAGGPLDVGPLPWGKRRPGSCADAVRDPEQHRGSRCLPPFRGHACEPFERHSQGRFLREVKR